MAELLPLLVALIVIAIPVCFAARNTRRQIARTLARRSNLSRDEFVQLMQPQVSKATTEFLWAAMLNHLEPKLTPHPDDSLIDDLPIDSEDWSMDWPREFAEARQFHHSNLPDWPADWPITVRNYGRWLDLGPAA